MHCDIDSIDQFLDLFVLQPWAVQQAVTRCLSVLPQIENADTPAGEQAAIEAFAELSVPAGWNKATEFVRSVLTELSNYPREHRGPFLRAALARARRQASRRDAFAGMLPDVTAAFQGMDERTRAVLVVMETLRYAGALVDADYNTVPDQLGDVDLDVLRRDPALATVMKAYDLAVVWIDQHP